LARMEIREMKSILVSHHGGPEALFGVVARGVVRVDITQHCPLAEAARAHSDLEAFKTIGVMVLKP